ncbi:hypothetical protein CCR75_006390 [Bremia lactucae]|uniref:Ataxin-10 domain-containing protein n=1 Tax=Bremia lactucae TaxID=4779 RepID=A0A976IKE6_BRELC|nr:hypothetical protein CCR75_006390 [Bremia lactucae]
MDFEALATGCRSSAFRETLNALHVWTQAADTITTIIKQLQEQIKSVASAKNADAYDHTIDTTDESESGLGYTLRVDGKNITAETIQSDFSPPRLEILDVGQSSAQIEALTMVFRFLRNACVACTSNQTMCLDAGLIKLAHQTTMHCCAWIDVEDEQLIAQFVLLAQVALQFSVNAVTSNFKCQAAAWKLYFFDDFQKILVECHQYRKVIAYAVALLLNCVNSSERDYIDTEKVNTRRDDMVCARSLVITLLHRCMSKSSNSSESAASLLHSFDIDDQDPAFEWIYMLFALHFRDGRVNDLYVAVSAHILSTLWSRVTPEQLILLRMFSLWVTSTLKLNATTNMHDGDFWHPLRQNTYEFVKTTWLYIVSEGDEDRPNEADEMRKKVWIKLEYEAKLMLLDVLGDLTVDRTIIDAKSGAELLQSLLLELERVWKLERQSPLIKNIRRDNSTLPMPLDQEPIGYRSGLIRVIGNFSFRHVCNQDLVREGGFLPLFLNHCNIDERNPMIREWSLVALRNLCEGNEANQQYIEVLRPQNMDTVLSSASQK